MIRWKSCLFYCHGFVRRCESVSENRSCNLHAPFCGMFCLHLVDVDHYVALIQTKSPTNCDIYLVESIFKTHFSGRFKKDVKVLTVESCIRKYKYFHKANIVLCYNIIKMSEGMRIFKNNAKSGHLYHYEKNIFNP